MAALFILSRNIPFTPDVYVGRRVETPAAPHIREPSLDFEVTRRLLETNLRDTWFFFSNRLREIKSSSKGTKIEGDLNYLIKEGAERIRTLLTVPQLRNSCVLPYTFRVLQYDLRRLGQLDGADIWRERGIRELSDMVQRRLHRLQNPPDCATAKKLICSIVSQMCGLGCEIHHLICCFMAAYGSHRTIVINSPGWHYTQKGWEDVFQPLSQTCTTFSKEITQWPGKPDSQTVLFIGVEAQPKPDHGPLAIPKDISDRLIRLHDDPSAWWVGQFIKYVFKLQPSVQEVINKAEKSFNFQHPVVGVHVRRTDKKQEASYHQLEEYMEQVEEYYDGLQIFDTNLTRRIYLSSEEPAIFKEAQEK
ncbi:alpha-(1,6)-fucosyltransferase-like [Procambarus clarkii]|uniref:alpha-(1,6)-fucosyltransferase-like n=1 Tax=Procambarus clarkii TaxID=6728 RepID=UPI0037428E79